MRKKRRRSGTPKPASQPLDAVILWIVSGATVEAVIDFCRRSFGASLAKAKRIVARARAKIRQAALVDRDQAVGTAMVRLNDVYRRSVKDSDWRNALAAQREINVLLALHAEPTEGDAASSADARRVIDLALGHLRPLELASPGEPLDELCRLAALKIIELRGRKS